MMVARGHARAQPCCWKNNENPHKHWSIQESGEALIRRRGNG
jgi:hypothetical protein